MRIGEVIGCGSIKETQMRSLKLILIVPLVALSGCTSQDRQRLSVFSKAKPVEESESTGSAIQSGFRFGTVLKNRVAEKLQSTAIVADADNCETKKAVVVGHLQEGKPGHSKNDEDKSLTDRFLLFKSPIEKTTPITTSSLLTNSGDAHHEAPTKFLGDLTAVIKEHSVIAWSKQQASATQAPASTEAPLVDPRGFADSPISQPVSQSVDLEPKFNLAQDNKQPDQISPPDSPDSPATLLVEEPESDPAGEDLVFSEQQQVTPAKISTITLENNFDTEPVSLNNAAPEPPEVIEDRTLERPEQTEAETINFPLETEPQRTEIPATAEPQQPELIVLRAIPDERKVKQVATPNRQPTGEPVDDALRVDRYGLPTHANIPFQSLPQVGHSKARTSNVLRSFKDGIQDHDISAQGTNGQTQNSRSKDPQSELIAGASEPMLRMRAIPNKSNDDKQATIARFKFDDVGYVESDINKLDYHDLQQATRKAIAPRDVTNTLDR